MSKLTGRRREDWQADSPPAVGNWWRYRCHDGRMAEICIYAVGENVLCISEAVWS